MARARGYSDDELVAAVSVSRSWRGVLRELGLAATSSSAIRSVRRQADRLGIDYRHFTGQRRWGDEDLVAAVEASDSWQAVCERLGLADRSSEVTLRGHAARLRLRVDHLGIGREPVSHPPLAATPDMANLSRAGSLLAASFLTLCGFQVSWPLEPTRYDLLAERGGILRVQVKTASVRSGASWQVWLSTTGRQRTTYDPDEIDAFFVIDGDLGFYLIPVAAVGGLHAVTLSGYTRYLVGRGLEAARPYGTSETHAHGDVGKEGAGDDGDEDA